MKEKNENIELVKNEEKKDLECNAVEKMNKKKIVIFIVAIFIVVIIIVFGILLGKILCEEYLGIDLCEGEDKVEITMLEKPVIYIYPETEMNVNVKLGKSELLTCTYPKYSESTGWEVTANPDGTLRDETNREYYSLYWEGKNAVKIEMEEGFVVKGEDTIEFLEEKLELLGLTEKEAQEFIIYWLPQMENNKYNLIRFETMEEIEENMPLEINPKPDTLIRIMMDWKSLDEYIEVSEQSLTSVRRSGYTVVEWGGSEIK